MNGGHRGRGQPLRLPDPAEFLSGLEVPQNLQLHLQADGLAITLGISVLDPLCGLFRPQVRGRAALSTRFSLDILKDLGSRPGPAHFSAAARGP